MCIFSPRGSLASFLCLAGDYFAVPGICNCHYYENTPPGDNNYHPHLNRSHTDEYIYSGAFTFAGAQFGSKDAAPCRSVFVNLLSAAGDGL